MINLTLKEFDSLLPAAIDPQGKIYEKTSEYIHKIEREVDKIIGPTLTSVVGRLSDETIQAAKRLIASRALYEALPHLDLVLTPTGFGVVSNSQVAPASAERVNRLRDALIRQAYDATDDLIDSLRSNPEWNNTPTAHSLFRAIIWRGDQMQAFGIESPSRGDMIKRKQIILSASISLAHYISISQISDWCSKLRTATATDTDLSAIDMAVECIAAYATGETSRFNIAKDLLLVFLEDNLDKFPSYASSSAYKANHNSHYENSKDAPCYFFGI